MRLKTILEKRFEMDFDYTNKELLVLKPKLATLHGLISSISSVQDRLDSKKLEQKLNRFFKAFKNDNDIIEDIEGFINDIDTIIPLLKRNKNIDKNISRDIDKSFKEIKKDINSQNISVNTVDNKKMEDAIDDLLSSFE